MEEEARSHFYEAGMLSRWELIRDSTDEEEEKIFPVINKGAASTLGISGIVQHDDEDEKFQNVLEK